jgi:hypothetical protein
MDVNADGEDTTPERGEVHFLAALAYLESVLSRI